MGMSGIGCFPLELIQWNSKTAADSAVAWISLIKEGFADDFEL
jgi:hypothetical protein